ncbi:RNA polymerase sigma factor [Chryseobacterium sp. 'Rf worker isolate 10']|uniref:RNA polymerase sigma factor n=1 Tax=Chryseobacterium sp. 'Rf worker isolate 10' TaxID=2887348 RepID=UPI003D6E4F9E
MFVLNNKYRDFQKEVFEKYSQLIFSHVFKKVGKRNDALDIVQNVFIHLWKYRKKLKNSSADGIIFRTCRQEIYHFYKEIKSGILGESVSIEELQVEICDYSEQELEIQLEKERRLEAVYETLDLVPEKRKQIFLLSKIEGRTRDEIAAEMNMSKSAIGNQIDKVMQFLISKLRK